MNRDECWDTVDVSTHSDAEAETKTDGDQFVCESFTDKLYVPKRSYKKYVKPWHIALSVVVIIIIIIIIVTTTIKKGSIANKDKDAAEYVSSGLMIRDSNSLSKYDPKDKSIKLILRTDKIIGSFDLYKDMTFWSEPNASKIVSAGNNENWNVPYKNADVIFEDLRFKVQAMAVDYFTKKLYAIDKTTGTAIVIDLQTKKYGILLTDLKQPQDILLDPANGLMFILQTESILRFNMDGTTMFEVILSANYIVGMTIDYTNKMIYWINNYNTISRTDYRGLTHEYIFKDQVNIISLTVSDNQLFWLWPSNGVHNATLWSCRIQTNSTTCLNHQIQPIGLANATSIKSLSHRGNFDDSNLLCIHHKNICQHMCLLSSEYNAGRSCGCYVGWESRSDPRSCQPIKEFLLYVLGSTVRGRILNFEKESFTEAFLPVALNTKSLNEKGTVDFDYDAHNDIFYISDDVHVYKMNLKRPSNQTILLTASSSHYIEDLAFDWLSMNLYYSNCSKTANNLHSLHALNVRETNKVERTLRTFSYRDGFGLKGCPYGTVIDASEGNIFFSAEESFFRSIYRMTLNGTRLKMDSKNIDYVHKYRLLAIDYEEKRLYWIHRSNLETRVRHVKFDGSDENYLHIGNMASARTIYVFKEWMYLSNELSIWRGNKTSGRDFHRVIPRTGSDLSEPVSAIKIVNLTLHATDDKNPCGKNNGGCEQFCYSSPKKTCGCVDDQNLRDDGRCS